MTIAGSRRPLRRLTALLAACVVAVAVGEPTVRASAEQQKFDEYQVKAAFVFNFAKFVQWPDPAGPLVIGVVGDSPIERQLLDTVRGRAIAGRPLQVRRVGAEELTGCHVLFISASEARRTPEILGRAERLAVLTVGETGSFLREGGIVRFFVDQGRVRFQINAAAADRAGLKINSQLLSLAAPR